VNQSHVTWNDEPSDPEISVGALAASGPSDGNDTSLVGERFGKYLIVGEVALGGMAEVFLGVQRGIEGFQKVVVIKRVLPQHNNNPDFVQMFIDEARLAARLEHANIVRTYEFGEVAGQYYTTMEYLPGEDLSKVLGKLQFSKQHMPYHLAAGIIANVCAGLHFAHEMTDLTGRPLGLVHRDVNPANIVVSYAGEVKLIDFGVAKTNETDTQTGTIKGKVAYMAPEQLLARGVDRRSDVFSTGVVLWELLVGRPLFLRDSEGATLYAIMNDPIAKPSRLRHGVPRALDEIVMRALSRTPADRYDTTDDMREALDEFLLEQPKYDPRVLGRLVEDLFGTTRAEAKRAISQTRSLGRNISLVMKLRTDVRADLAERLDALASSGGIEAIRASTNTLTAPREERSSRGFAIVLAAVILVCIAVGVTFLVAGDSLFKSESRPAAPAIAAAVLQIESTPPGAAISIGGEPTGLVTPATIRGIATKQVPVRLELPGHATIFETIEIPSAAGTVVKQFALVAAPAHLKLEELPRGAVVVLDGVEQTVGDGRIAIGTGTREIQISVRGRVIVQQKIQIVAGEQVWKLSGNELVSSK
jgi:serine/threonine-protein kinase